MIKVGKSIKVCKVYDVGKMSYNTMKVFDRKDLYTMPRGRKTFPGYYSPAEAMNKLGISKEMLYTYVRNERLTRHFPPGRKQAVFKKEQIDELAREIQAFIATSGRTSTTFSKACPEDMDEGAKLINALFHHWPDVERWKGYLRRNPDIGYLLRAGDQIVGCAFIFPLAPERITELFSYEETQAPSIMSEEIQPYRPGVAFHLYIRAVGILPDIPKIDKRVWGGQLLTKLIGTFIAFGTHGIDIKTIQARSRTPDGIRILRHIGFTEVPSTTTSHNFLIDVEHSGLPAVQEYKAAFAEWKAAHPFNPAEPSAY